MRSRGMALVMVLWIVAALTLVVLAGSEGMKKRSQWIGLDLERLRADILLESATQIIAGHLVAQPNLAGKYQTLTLKLDATDITIVLVPSAGLIDPNVVSNALFQAFLQVVGGLNAEQSVLVTSRVKDWIDPDNDPTGPGGAEAPQYRAAGWTPLPRNAAMVDASELQSVWGMSPELYGRISPYLGLNGRYQLDVGAAPPILVDVLTGQPGVGRRLQGMQPGPQAEALAALGRQGYFAAGQGGVSRDVRVTASIEIDGGRRWQRVTWISLSQRPDSLAPWTTLNIQPTQRATMQNQEAKP